MERRNDDNDHEQSDYIYSLLNLHAMSDTWVPDNIDPQKLQNQLKKDKSGKNEGGEDDDFLRVY